MMKSRCVSPGPRSSSLLPSRSLAEQVFSRAAGAPLVGGNHIRLLIDARENYPAWIDRLESAVKTIHIEMYIFLDDETGTRFAEVLMEKARRGVRVRILYDWVGCFKTSEAFWLKLRNAGAEVRHFNPIRWDNPIGWLSRDHRKVIVVDGRTAFVTGLCIGRMWEGYPDKGIAPWRDTGIEICGPGVADVENAFSEIWAVAGTPLLPEEIPDREKMEAEGDINLRVIATVPNAAGLYRVDNLVAALARKSLWLSDAYFVGISSYIQALRSAAMDGVDVRLLVPGATDLPVLRAISRSGYEPLLQAGIRVFEWNGPMMHAKTAVADGTWARVGSTNLNIASWIGNYELDIAVEDTGFAGAMEEMFLSDLENSTEIVLSNRNRVTLTRKKPRIPYRHRRLSGSPGRTGSGALRAGFTIGAALTEHRLLGHAEAKITGVAGILLLILALIGLFFPLAVTIPLGIFCGWISLTLLIRTYRLLTDKGENDGKTSRKKKK